MVWFQRLTECVILERKIKKCSLAIQINNIAYDVKGTCIDDHGDSHGKEGFCNTIRVANLKSEIKKKYTNNSIIYSSEKLIFFIINPSQR